MSKLLLIFAVLLVPQIIFAADLMEVRVPFVIPANSTFTSVMALSDDTQPGFEFLGGCFLFFASKPYDRNIDKGASFELESLSKDDNSFATLEEQTASLTYFGINLDGPSPQSIEELSSRIKQQYGVDTVPEKPATWFRMKLKSTKTGTEYPMSCSFSAKGQPTGGTADELMKLLSEYGNISPSQDL